LIREHLFDKRAPADSMFRWRGGDVSRLEGLSDGVFAVTLTLLVVSLDVPNTFYERHCRRQSSREDSATALATDRA